MNREQISQLSYDCVLPAAIFFNENLEPSAIKLYAMVRNLSKIEGYCYATNKYLADLLESDERTIRRWIASLLKAGYLESHITKKGIQTTRRLYLSEKFKKFLRQDISARGGGQNCPPGGAELPAIKEEYKKEEYQKESAKAHSSDQTETVRSKPPEIKFSFDIHRFENIETRDIEAWRELYPTVDIDRELKAMTEWIWSNEKKAKSKKHWRKFINHWLSKNNEQNINKEAFKSRGFSNEIDRRPRDKDGNVKPSQYAGMF